MFDSPASIQSAKPSYIVTSSGRLVRPFQLTREEFNVADVITSIAHQNRYGGHARTYSVGEHCYHVSRAAGHLARLRGFTEVEVRACERHGLTHDFEEGYLQDTLGPFLWMGEFAFKRDAGLHLREKINTWLACDASGPLSMEPRALVDEVDRRIVANEALVLFGARGVRLRLADVAKGERPGVYPDEAGQLTWLLPEPLEVVTIHQWSPDLTEAALQGRFRMLFPEWSI